MGKEASSFPFLERSLGLGRVPSFCLELLGKKLSLEVRD